MGRIFDFIANSGDGVFAVDRQQSIILWNQRAKGILGFTAEEVQGKRCYGIVCGRDALGCTVCRRGCNAITSAEKLQPAMATDIEVQTKEGRVWVNLSTVVVPSRRGELSVLVHMFREVTREHDLLRAAEDLAAIFSAQTPGDPARRRGPDASRPVDSIELTRREREILICLASGESTDEIADKLYISPRTVGNHVNNILNKLDVHSRLEAVAYSVKNGLV